MMRRSPLWKRNLLLLAAGNGVSSFGNAVYLIAMILVLKDIGDSALILGLFQFLALIPGFLLSPVTGVLIDRWSRRRILVVSDALRGFLMVAAAVLIWRSPEGTLIYLLVLSFVAGIGHAFFVPAAQAIIPEIVPPQRFALAGSIRAGCSQVLNMTGNAVGGVLLVLLGAPLLLVVNGISFLLSALQEMWIRPEFSVPAGKPVGSAAGSLAEVIRFLRKRRDIRDRIASQAGMFLLSPVLLLTLPFLLLDILGVSPETLGFVFALSLAGGITTFIVLNRMSSARLVTLPLGPGGYVLFGIVLVLLVGVPAVATVALAAFLAGAAAAAVYLSASVGIQLTTPADMHGRLFAFMEGASAAAAPAAYLTAGLVLDALGHDRFRLLFLAVALPTFLWAVAGVFRRRK